MTRRAVVVLAGATWLTVMAAATALGAEPTPSPIGGDPRSPGEGPGLVGDPLLAIGGVLAIGLAAVVLTALWVRLTADRTKVRDR